MSVVTLPGRGICLTKDPWNTISFPVLECESFLKFSLGCKTKTKPTQERRLLCFPSASYRALLCSLFLVTYRRLLSHSHTHMKSLSLLLFGAHTHSFPVNKLYATCYSGNKQSNHPRGACLFHTGGSHVTAAQGRLHVLRFGTHKHTHGTDCVNCYRLGLRFHTKTK